mmetsp:Transcript_115376/g.230038  ORF Transcript_115376/g.230038 Transcript_115376/m.230038 type:complete len:336 (-) Transcript_115376:134-1141(-)
MHLEFQWKAARWSGSHALWMLSALAGFPVFNASRPPGHNSRFGIEGGSHFDEDEFASHVIAAIAPQGRWRPQTAASGHQEHGSKDHSGWKRSPTGTATWHSSWMRNGHWQIEQKHGGSQHGKGSVVPRALPSPAKTAAEATPLHVGDAHVSAREVEHRERHVIVPVPSSALQIDGATEEVSAGGSNTSGCEGTQQSTASLMAAGASCHIDCACPLFGGVCLNQQHCTIIVFSMIIVGFSCAIVALTWCSTKRSRTNGKDPISACDAPAPVPPPPEAAPPDRPHGRTLAEKVGSKPAHIGDAQTPTAPKAAFPVFRGNTSRRENAKGSAGSTSIGG